MFLLFLLFSLPLFAKGKQEGKIRCSIEQIPASFDPRIATTPSSKMIARMLFEGLTRIGSDEKPELALAERYTVSRDGLTYTFFLRKAKWTNGTQILADDFVSSWRSLLSSELLVLDKAKEALEGLCSSDEIGVTALNKTTLEVRLTHPIPHFLSLLAMPSFFPIPSQSLHKKEKKLVSNGPFKLHKQKENLQLEVSRSYWDVAQVLVKEIELVPSSNQKATHLFTEGELDCVPTPAVFPLLRHFSSPSLETSFLTFNTNIRLLQDPLFRRALAYAIDRHALIEKGLEVIPSTALVPSSFGLEERPYFPDGALEESRLLFAQAREGRPFSEKEVGSLSLLYISGDFAELTAKAVEQFWANAFGFQLRLEPVDEALYFERLQAKEYQIALCSYQASISDPLDFLRLFTSKEEPLNYSQWEEQDYTTLFEAAITARDQNVRRALMRASEKLLLEAMPLIPLYNRPLFYLKSPKLSSLHLSPTGDVDFKWAHMANAN